MAARWAGLRAISAPTDREALRVATSNSPNARSRRIRSSTAACEWSEVTITAYWSRKASGPPAACIRRSICRSAAAIEVTCACGPFLCDQASLSGSENSMKSNRSFSTRNAPTQPVC